MGVYSNLISVMESELQKKEQYEIQLNKAKNRKDLLLKEQNVLEEAFKLLSTISDKQLNDMLDNIEMIINSVLAEVFPSDDPRIIKINKSMLKATTPQLKISLENGKGYPIDLQIQEGMGLKQIVSVLFTLIVVSIREDRPIVILDECLSGLHNKSKRYMEELLRTFAKQGFQFVLVEYNCDSLGKIYNMEKRAGVTQIKTVHGKYNPDSVYVSEPDLSDIDMDNVIEEDEFEEVEDF